MHGGLTPSARLEESPGSQEGTAMTAAFLTYLISGMAVGQVHDPRLMPPPPILVSPGEAPRHVGHRHHPSEASGILGPGPGDGWGFPNGAPDGYGWYAPGADLPLGADRTPEYYFPRYFTVPAQTMFFPTYFNKYVSRGQRYLPWAGCGGMHPVGQPPEGPARLSMHPYDEATARGPVVGVPEFGGEVEARPITPGESDMIP